MSIIWTFSGSNNSPFLRYFAKMWRDPVIRISTMIKLLVTWFGDKGDDCNEAQPLNPSFFHQGSVQNCPGVWYYLLQSVMSNSVSYSVWQKQCRCVQQRRTLLWNDRNESVGWFLPALAYKPLDRNTLHRLNCSRLAGCYKKQQGNTMEHFALCYIVPGHHNEQRGNTIQHFALW